MIFRNKLKTLIKERPRVVLPEINRMGRYVQIYIRDDPFLRCGMNNTGSLVYETLGEFEIAPKTVRKSTNHGFPSPSGFPVPDKMGRDYKVVGAGFCLLKKCEETIYYELCLFINSRGVEFQEYPRGIDDNHLRKIDIYLRDLGTYPRLVWG